MRTEPEWPECRVARGGDGLRPRHVDRMEADPASMLHHYRRAIALRQAHSALATGAQSDLTQTGPILSFRRNDGVQEIFCAFNLGEDAAEIEMPGAGWTSIGEDLGGVAGAGDRGVPMEIALGWANYLTLWSAERNFNDEGLPRAAALVRP